VPAQLRRVSLPGRDHLPAEIISHAAWLYFRFPLSLRHVDEILAARGITVSHETVRQWGLKFGQSFATQIRRRLPRAGDRWHLDEVAVKIAGVRHWLWRAVDQDGTVLDILVQSRRDTRAAKRLLRKLLKRQTRPPRVMVTDKLASYGAAKREVTLGVEHRQHRGLNNRAENSHRCKNRYLISRTVSDQSATMALASLPRPGVLPSSPAPTAHRYAALGFERSTPPGGGH